MTDNTAEIKCRINNIDITDDNITGRAGLTSISRYLRATKIPDLLSEKFSYLKNSSKGTNSLLRFPDISTVIKTS